MIRVLLALMALSVLLSPRVGAAPKPCDPGPQAVQEWKGYDARHPQFRMVTLIAAGPSGSVYLLDQDLYLVREFSSEGAFLRTWELPDDRHPFMVAMAASDSFLYVSDGHSTYQCFRDGSIATWNRGAANNGLAIDQEGHLFLSASLSRINALEMRRQQLKPSYFHALQDSFTKELGIWKLSSQGDVLDHWNAPSWPITVDRKGVLYAVEPDSGGALLIITDKPERRPWRLNLESRREHRSLAVSPSGHFFVNDHKNVIEVDGKGNVLRRWCDPGPQYDPLSGPVSLSVDSEGHLYVAEFYKSRVLKFDLGTP